MAITATSLSAGTVPSPKRVVGIGRRRPGPSLRTFSGTAPSRCQSRSVGRSRPSDHSQIPHGNLSRTSGNAEVTDVEARVDGVQNVVTNDARMVTNDAVGVRT